MKLTRRQWLGNMVAGTAAAAAGTALQGCRTMATANKFTIGDPRVGGPFPILSTPFTAAGAVDYEVLAKEAKFVDWCKSPGMIWPQSGDSVDLLTTEEKLQGMDVLAKAMQGRHSALCLGIQGKTVEEMLVYANHAEKLNPTCFISRPMDTAKTEDDLRTYWRALGKVATRPVIIQTSGGTTFKGVAPSNKLLIELAREFPNVYGYVKEETGPILGNMRELHKAKPVIKRVFSAMGGFGWLYEVRRAGSEGLITERAVYADLLAYIWKLMQSGEDPVGLDNAYSKLLLMLNLKESISCNQLRGYHLYVWQKRGVFKNRLSREYGPKGVIPEKPKIAELKLSQEDIDEIEARFEALRPYMKAVAPELD